MSELVGTGILLISLKAKQLFKSKRTTPIFKLNNYNNGVDLDKILYINNLKNNLTSPEEILSELERYGDIEEVKENVAMC
jgi:hypothetical protein